MTSLVLLFALTNRGKVDSAVIGVLIRGLMRRLDR
jgi:hypothetical protein